MNTAQSTTGSSKRPLWAAVSIVAPFAGLVLYDAVATPHGAISFTGNAGLVFLGGGGGGIAGITAAIVSFVRHEKPLWVAIAGLVISVPLAGLLLFVVALAAAS